MVKVCVGESTGYVRRNIETVQWIWCEGVLAESTGWVHGDIKTAYSGYHERVCWGEYRMCSWGYRDCVR